MFRAFQLQTNYRSNQEILDFANVALAGIEANQYANIQLRANDLSAPTAASFKSKVRLHYERLPKIAAFKDRFESTVMGNVIRPYLDEKLAAGEQVAFLAYTRRHVAMFEQMVRRDYPDKTVVSLVPEKQYNSTVFSQFIKSYWDAIRFSPSQTLTIVIYQMIMGNIANLVPRKSAASQAVVESVERMVKAWMQKDGAAIKAKQDAYAKNLIPLEELMDFAKESMMDFEIQNNAVKQRMVSNRNEQRKKQNQDARADIVLSTIHSAKGLEFDNCVVLYKAENGMDEPDKRMYYVALTRARMSELIVAFGPYAKARISADYDAISKRLEAADKARAAAGPAQAAQAAPKREAVRIRVVSDGKVPFIPGPAKPGPYVPPDLGKAVLIKNPDAITASGRGAKST